MSEETVPRAIYLLLFLVLMASSLAARRLPFKDAGKMALAWIGIFALIFSIVLFKDEWKELGTRMTSWMATTFLIGEQVDREAPAVGVVTPPLEQPAVQQERARPRHRRHQRIPFGPQGGELARVGDGRNRRYHAASSR